MFAMLLYARMDGFKDVQRRIGNSFLRSVQCKANSRENGNQSREQQIAPKENAGEILGESARLWIALGESS